MQLFTIEQVFEVLVQTNNLINKLARTLFDTSISEISRNLGNLMPSLIQGDWQTFIVSTFIIFALMRFVYKLARNKPLAIIGSIIDKK